MSMDEGPRPTAQQYAAPQYAPLPPASSRATTAMILGILGLVCCAPLGPVAWYQAVQERKDIRAGLASPAGEGQAVAGMVLGIIATVNLAIGLLVGMLYLLALFGLFTIGALANR